MVFRCVITGASGFIGEALIKKFKDNPQYMVYTLNHEMLLSKVDLTHYFSDFQPDYIFHLAAYGNHSTQTEDLETFQANVVGTWNLLEVSKDIPYKAFINFGSSSEYGQKSSLMSERDIPESLTMYGCTKVASTYLARAFAKKYNKPIVTVRPFSVYGPGEADHRFIPTVVKSLLFKKVLSLDIKAKHDWIYITDFLEALGIISDNASLLSGQTVNIGTGIETSNKQIVEYLQVIANTKANIRIIEGMRQNDSQTWKADINKIQTFNWSPQWLLSTALFETYLYYKNKYYGN